MAGRLLRRWLMFPLKEVKAINQRLDVVEYFFRVPSFRYLVEEQLSRIGDLERIISKVAVGRVSPREVVQLKNALMAIEPIKRSLMPTSKQSILFARSTVWTGTAIFLPLTLCLTPHTGLFPMPRRRKC